MHCRAAPLPVQGAGTGAPLDAGLHTRVLLGDEAPARRLDPEQLPRVLRFLGRGGPPKHRDPVLRIGVIGASQARAAGGGHLGGLLPSLGLAPQRMRTGRKHTA